MTGHPRAGVVVTGTEVLSGVIADRNGPWLSEKLRSVGVELAHIDVVGDRPEDLAAALAFMADLDLVITSGGLGPTADDLTTQVVAGFTGRPMEHDPALEERIWTIVSGYRSRWPDADEGALRAGARKQAFIPRGAWVLEPVGTAPGVIVRGSAGGPLVVVLPGPPGELQPMWEAALAAPPLRELLAGAGTFEQRILRMTGLPEAELARSLRVVEDDGVPVGELEVTTCLRRGELEVTTVFAPAAEAAYARFEAALVARHGIQVFSRDGSTVDDIVAGLLTGPPAVSVAVAESCTGGLMAARLTDRAGSSAYVLGGVVAYSNEAKVAQVGVPSSLIESDGAVSAGVARALASGAAERFGAKLGIGITGIAGPGGGTPEKPVGTVCVCVAGGPDGPVDRTLRLSGGRTAIRERTTTAVMHLLRGILQGEDTRAITTAA